MPSKLSKKAQFNKWMQQKVQNKLVFGSLSVENLGFSQGFCTFACLLAHSAST